MCAMQKHGTIGALLVGYYTTASNTLVTGLTSGLSYVKILRAPMFESQDHQLQFVIRYQGLQGWGSKVGPSTPVQPYGGVAHALCFFAEEARALAHVC
jgi:hypothetical protein